MLYSQLRLNQEPFIQLRILLVKPVCVFVRSLLQSINFLDLDGIWLGNLDEKWNELISVHVCPVSPLI
jgi:hypothetical protein